MIIGKPDGAAAPDGDLIQAGTDAGFRKQVIEQSLTQPVLVDFWAPWCGPCRTLTPLLEKAVRAAKGRIKLVKINIDEHNQIATQLRVQSIPAVFAFDQGRPVDGFMGALPEGQIKAFIERLLGEGGGEIEAVLEEAAESMRVGDLGGAAQAYAMVLQADPENAKALAGLARCYLMGGDRARAEETLALAGPEAAKDPDVLSVRSQLELSEQAAEAGDPNQLASALAASPNDPAKHFDLAMAHIGRGNMGKAADILLDAIALDREWNEQAARKQLLKLMEAAGAQADWVKIARKRLSAVWLS